MTRRAVCLNRARTELWEPWGATPRATRQRKGTRRKGTDAKKGRRKGRAKKGDAGCVPYSWPFLGLVQEFEELRLTSEGRAITIPLPSEPGPLLRAPLQQSRRDAPALQSPRPHLAPTTFPRRLRQVGFRAHAGPPVRLSEIGNFRRGTRAAWMKGGKP